jgi:hypothetical protein
MKKILSSLLLLVGLSTANIVNTESKPDYWYGTLDTAYLYEYDLYTITNSKVEVKQLDYTHKLYETDSSIMYLKYNDIDTTTIEKVFNENMFKNNIYHKTLKEYWKLVGDIDLCDVSIKWVFSEYTWVGFDVNGVLYSWTKFNIPVAMIPYRAPQLNDILTNQNTYSVIALNGRIITDGKNIRSFENLKTIGIPTGVYIIQINTGQYIVNQRILIK